MDGPPDGDFCSICLENFDVPCQANCSHWFCGKCILMVREHSLSTYQPCRCPLCRRPITLLIPTEDSVRERNPAVRGILKRVETYNRLFGGSNNSLFQRIQDLPFLLQRLSRELVNSHRSLPLVIRARVYIYLLFGVIYVVSPVDIIPEAVHGVVGLLDDLLVVHLCLLHVGTLYRSVLYYRHGGS